MPSKMLTMMVSSHCWGHHWNLLLPRTKTGTASIKPWVFQVVGAALEQWTEKQQTVQWCFGIWLLLGSKKRPPPPSQFVLCTMPCQRQPQNPAPLTSGRQHLGPGKFQANLLRSDDIIPKRTYQPNWPAKTHWACGACPLPPGLSSTSIFFQYQVARTNQQGKHVAAQRTMRCDVLHLLSQHHHRPNFLPTGHWENDVGCRLAIHAKACTRPRSDLAETMWSRTPCNHSSVQRAWQCD